MNLRRLLLLTLVLIGAAPLRAETPPSPARTAFIQATDLPGGSRSLQTASIEYRPAQGTGPSLWLVGVAHLGTADYYRALQQRLDRQTVVLYEGVGLHEVKKGPGATGRTGLQSTLARALGLEFQLDVIDYRSPAFINSDLHLPELEQEVKKRGPAEDAAQDQLLDQLLGALQGEGPAAGLLNQLVSALGSSPQMREMAKTVLIEVLGQAGELLAATQQSLPEMRDLFDVILRQRNEIVIRDLTAQLGQRQPGESIAVFYGAAHMDEIARHLTTRLGYAPVRTEWHTAFSASAAETGLNSPQIRLMLEMMRSQLAPSAR